MATTRPRITITLTERQHAILRSLSKSTGQSMSSNVAELLELALPTLERMAVAMQAIAKTRENQIGQVRAQLDEAQAVLEPLAASLVAQTDLFWGMIEQASQAGPEAGASPTSGQRAQAAATPPTNRGVTPHPAKPSKPKPGAASSQVRSRSQPAKGKGAKRAAI